MSLPTILLILAATSIGATVITILIAFRSERESRSAIFPIVREEEAIRARRARISVFVWAAIAALFLGGWLASLRLIDPNPALITASTPDQSAENAALANATQAPTQPNETSSAGDEAQSSSTERGLPEAMIPSPTVPVPLAEALLDTSTTVVTPSPTAVPPTFTPTATETPLPPTAIPTETPVPPTATATPTSEPTSTPAPTNTPTPAAFVVVKIPTSGPRTPAPPGARMGPIQFATELSPDHEAINPNDIFPEGIRTIYAVFPYSGMEDGLDFKVIWYQNGVELWRDENEWRWGGEARFFSYINSPGEGLYKLELHVNDSILATGLFEIG